MYAYANFETENYTIHGKYLDNRHERLKSEINYAYRVVETMRVTKIMEMTIKTCVYNFKFSLFL